MEHVLLFLVFVGVIIWMTAVIWVPFSINKSEQHLKRIAEAIEKISNGEGR